jgi:two-component system, chemotaxis family, sensor kinase CheA
MVRNSADHGIETPEDRRAAGKPERGRIEVSVEELADEIVVKVADDGRGIDRRALAEKAAKMGLIAPEATLSDAELVQMLFLPGVSTAKEVTDVSGRGVGMDVVKRAIDEIGGRIEVATQAGEGTTMTIHLPKTVTTQILDSYIVVSEGGRYVFPLKSVHRCFRPSRTDVSPVQGRGLCVKDGAGGLLRVMSLARHLGMRGAPLDVAELQEGILVVVEGTRNKAAVHVDGIDGVRRVVLKNMVGLENAGGDFAGGAIMGDGSVALVLDVDRIVGA